MFKGSAAELYKQLEPDRLQYLTRARSCSVLTIPTLVPPDGHGPSTIYPTPYQSLGARGVNNLASKLLLSLLPNSPFFRLTTDDFALQKLTGGDPTKGAEVDKALNKVERAVMTEVDSIGLRAPVFELLKQLIVAGNCLLYMPQQGRPRIFRLEQYVAQRDPYGNLMNSVWCEDVAKDLLTDDEQALVGDTTDNKPTSGGPPVVRVYTHYYRDGGNYRLYQEINGHKIAGTEGNWPIDKGPALALRWTTVDGENYGRSYVEEYLGDLQSLEGLMEAVTQGAAAAARLLILVNPNGTTRLKDITDAPNGKAVAGNEQDVTFLQTQKSADLNIAMQAVEGLQERLSYAFLLNSAVQRDAERVTAEEVRYMANELETALGGVYSVLAQDFQLPLANRLMDRMVKQRRLPKLPKGIVSPAIVTGLEALGRGNDLQKLQMAFQALEPFAQAAAQRIDVGNLITRVFTACGINSDGLVKSDDQMAQEAQQAQQQQMQQLAAETLGKAGVAAVPNTVKAIHEGMNPNG